MFTKKLFWVLVIGFLNLVSVDAKESSLNLNKLFTVMSGKFKFQVQDNDLKYLFWRFDKYIALSEKKPPSLFCTIVFICAKIAAK